MLYATGIVIFSALEKLKSAAINSYVPRILRQVDVLQDAIARFGNSPVPINDVMMWFAFDSMGEFAFNQSFDMMKTGQWHKVVQQQRSGLSLLGPMNPTVWAIRLAFSFLSFAPPVSHFKAMIEFCGKCIERRLKVRFKTHSRANNLLNMNTWMLTIVCH